MKDDINLLVDELKCIQTQIKERSDLETASSVSRAIAEIEQARNQINQTPFVPEEKHQ